MYINFACTIILIISCAYCQDVLKTVKEAYGDWNFSQQFEDNFPILKNKLYTDLIYDPIKNSLTHCCHSKTFLFGKTCGNGTIIDVDRHCSKGDCNHIQCYCDKGCWKPNKSWLPGDIIGCLVELPGIVKPQHAVNHFLDHSESMADHYYHVFIYLDNGKVATIAYDRVVVKPLENELSKGSECTVFNDVLISVAKKLFPDQPEKHTMLPKERIIERAKAKIGQNWDFEFFNHNNEHFVTDIAFGESFQSQPHEPAIN